MMPKGRRLPMEQPELELGEYVPRAIADAREQEAYMAGWEAAEEDRGTGPWPFMVGTLWGALLAAAAFLVALKLHH